MKTLNYSRAKLGFARNMLAAALLVVLSAHADEQTAGAAQEKSTDEIRKEKTELGTIVVTGSRAKGHTVQDSPTPIDTIAREALQSAGSLEVGKLLQTLEPSVNFSTTFVSDGTDIIRPITLRGLGPDQVLVLINGKRRHQQALVNVQQTVGRGSAGTDINAIPESMIDHIEVLRDGAAAQYGSDAIAGVVNIILKKQTDETQLSGQAGQTYKGDGELYSGSVNTGFKFGEGGYNNLSLEYRHRDETNRAGPDSLRVNPPRVDQRLGDPIAKDLYFWLNGGLPFGTGEVYWFGGASRRKGDSSGFFRSKGDDRTVPDIYPNGFLPNILTKTTDASLVFGYRAPINDIWSYDLSVNYGRNKFDFHEGNTVNVSWWYEPKPGGGIYAQSPRSAFTGALAYDQIAFDADFKGSLDWGIGTAPIYVGTGFEYRDENYKITPGDPVSYTYGRTNNGSIVIHNQNGGFAAPGTQGFPGFTPGTAVDDGRDNIALYIDAENQLTEHFLASAAARWEHYSDFGSTLTGKLTGRYDFTPSFALRGTIANGFRAPGVQQEFYSQVSTNLNSAGVLTDTLTARQGSAVTSAFGIQPLKEETSINGSLGIVAQPADHTRLTADLYRIKINNRIIFSSNIQPESAASCAPDLSNCPIRRILDPLHVGQVLFFTNAIDTRTTGLDLVAEQDIPLSNGDDVTLSADANFSHTKVTKRKSQSAILPPNVLFDDTQVTLVEKGQPRQHYVLSANYKTGGWDLTARANYFGDVEGQGFTPGIIQKWGGKWLFDLNVAYAFTRNAKVSVGGLNIFDTYPDKWDRTTGAPFPELGFTYCWETCPFGINGGSYYARFDYSF
ncbi:TonB-dependent receptor [Dokdonella soli]|uniref:TonB-dependent receptor n=1 Tax=Dokdonella soli TaxID=529810 RepID=A0ABN1IJK6_9GAMM